MKKNIIIILVLLFAGLVQAQKVTVSQTDQKINKINRTGAAIYIELDEKTVSNLWKKKFKDYGKVSTDGGDYYIEAATIPGINSTVRTISRVEKSGKGTMVWMAIDLGDEWAQNGGKGWASLEKLLHEFGVVAYKEDIMEQIADAEKAMEKTVKQQEKTIKEGENLQSDMENNSEEKVRLENDLKDNAAQKVKLTQDIEQNKKDKERASADVDKMKKAVDVVKQRLNQIQ